MSEELPVEEANVSPASGPQDSSTPVSPLSNGSSAEAGPKPGSLLRDRFKQLTVTVDKPVHEAKYKKALADLFRPLRMGESIKDLYEFKEDIYSGGAKGKVLVAEHKQDKKEVVVKIRTKSSNKRGEYSWRQIMAQLYSINSSEHVLGINRIYEDDNNFYIVMPKCDGGEFFEFLATETEVPESECKRIVREILTAVGHLHANNLLHRDIKPENIMFNLLDGDPKSPKSVKLIDFDTCFGYAPGTPKSRQFVGTPGFIAPEALRGEICPQSDLWSIGVITYILMTGEMPWTSSLSLEEGVVGSPGAIKMYSELKKEVIDWELEPWPSFPLARDLCQKLMAFELADRIQDVKSALAHPWLVG